MKRLGILILAASALVAGCTKKSEAEKLGYRGADISDILSYFTIDGVVTNWVPVRLFEVVENYELSTNETALLASLDMPLPGLTVKELPKGYEVDEDGPWITVWKKVAEHLGQKGARGFYSHFNEDSGKYETGEAYFSTYWPTRADALVAQENLKNKFVAEFSPLKIHEYPDSWIAEYLRLRVMCAVGMRNDGTWSCMLSVADKANTGCGPWEPHAVQQQHKENYLYEKALRAWRAAVEGIRAKNRADCAAALKAKGLAGLEGLEWVPRDDGSHTYCKIENYDETNSVEKIWNDACTLLKTAYGLLLPEKPETQDVGNGYKICGGVATNDTPYEARVDIAIPPKTPEIPEGEEAEFVAPVGQWRLIIHEKMLPSNELPARPERGKVK